MLSFSNFAKNLSSIIYSSIILLALNFSVAPFVITGQCVVWSGGLSATIVGNHFEHFCISYLFMPKLLHGGLKYHFLIIKGNYIWCQKHIKICWL
jgi:hypothetical protein